MDCESCREWRCSVRKDPLCAAGNVIPVSSAMSEMASAWKKGGTIRMENMNKENQFPDAVSRSLDGGFNITLPYGGAFVPQKDKAYMCVGTERDGHQPIFRIEGVNLSGDGVRLNRETVKSPVGICEDLECHEKLARELVNPGMDPAPIQRRDSWYYYYVHENLETGVNTVNALYLNHLGILNVRCMKEDIFFVLDNTSVEE